MRVRTRADWVVLESRRKFLREDARSFNEYMEKKQLRLSCKSGDGGRRRVSEVVSESWR